MNSLAGLFKWVWGFWFQAVSPIRMLVFERIMVATFLYYMVERFSYAREWLTSYGFHITAETRNWHHNDPFPLLTDNLILPFGILLFGSGIAVILGFHRRPMMWVLFACAVYVQNVDIISSFTLNKLYILSFLLLALTPLPGGLRIRPGQLDQPVSAWPVRTLQATLLIQYFTAATCKMLHGDWLLYPDTLWTHVQGIYCTDAAAWLLRVLPKDSWAVQMYIALVFELVAAFLFMFGRTRMIGFIWGAGFHLMIALTMHQLLYFSLQLMTFYVLFLSDGFLRRAWKPLTVQADVSGEGRQPGAA